MKKSRQFLLVDFSQNTISLNKLDYWAQTYRTYFLSNNLLKLRQLQQFGADCLAKIVWKIFNFTYYYNWMKSKFFLNHLNHVLKWVLRLFYKLFYFKDFFQCYCIWKNHIHSEWRLFNDNEFIYRNTVKLHGRFIGLKIKEVWFMVFICQDNCKNKRSF